MCSIQKVIKRKSVLFHFLYNYIYEYIDDAYMYPYILIHAGTQFPTSNQSDKSSPQRLRV